MAPPQSDWDKQMQYLEAEIRRLEAEFNMFFAGRLPRPPWETRNRIAALVKKWDRGYIQSAMDRFQFDTLQRRFQTFADLWDRGLRAREEGRAGPFVQKKPAAKPDAPQKQDKIMHVAAFRDPLKEMDKLHDLYNSLVDARREVGEEAVPFHKFAELVKTQVTKLKTSGTPEVAFRVAVKDGKVNFTARALKSGTD